MEEVKLYTRTGGYVTTVLVPVFTPRAEVIVWGQRTFVLRLDGQYYEGMMWPILPGFTKGEYGEPRS